jgi:LmbE family N-acetylglucosaminyl deacetylase
MDDIQTIRRNLERLLYATAEQHHQLDIREQELAAAMELLAVDPRIASAYQDGRRDAYRRCQLLIQEQLSYLSPQSSTRIVLTRLAQLVGGVDG